MAFRPWIVALVAFLAACGSSAAAPRPTCGPARARTLAVDGRARVYALRRSVYGCSVARGRSFRLGRAARALGKPRVGPVAVAGDFAAYGVQDFGIDTVLASVVVRRLTDGKQFGDYPVTRAAFAESFQSVGSIAAKGDGAVAWIGVVHSIVAGHGAVEVHAAGPAAETSKVLDSGPQIVTNSLRLRGSTLTWRHGTAMRHATLR